MAANPIYIETEEEIPEVIERVRRTPAEDATLVLPTRSRFAQSRFNFQLLKQYAAQMGKRVAIVSPDPAVQQMAEESGFRAFRAVEQLGGEAALETAGAAAAPAAARSLPLPPPRSAPGAATAGPRLVITAPARLPSKVATEVRPGFALLYVGAALLLVAGLIAGLFYVPAADVMLVAQAQPFSQAITIEAQPGQPPVRVRTVSDTKTATQGFKATGTQKVPGTVATGSVVFTSKCSFDVAWNQPGARLRGTGGIQFAATEAFTVPAGGRTGVPIKATSPGANGNLDAGQITTIDAPNVPSCLSVNNPDATSGGQDEKTNTIIQPSDLDTARQALETQLRQQITDDLTKQAQPGEKLGDSPVFTPPDFSADHKLGDVVTGFSATVKLAAEGAYYNTEDLQKAFNDGLAKKVPAGNQLTDNKVKATYSTDQAPGGHLTFKATASSFIAPKIDFNRLSAQLTAKSTTEARAILAKQPVQSVDIKQTPFRLPFMPLSGSRIHIQYVVQQGTPAPSGSPAPKKTP